MALGKFPVSGRSTDLDNRTTSALVVGAGGGCLDIFLYSIFPLFFLLQEPQ